MARWRPVAADAQTRFRGRRGAARRCGRGGRRSRLCRGMGGYEGWGWLVRARRAAGWGRVKLRGVCDGTYHLPWTKFAVVVAGAAAS